MRTNLKLVTSINTCFVTLSASVVSLETAGSVVSLATADSVFSLATADVVGDGENLSSACIAYIHTNRTTCEQPTCI